MLDLDHLAEEKARRSNQAKESWSQAVWSADFQKVSTNMTDGEVEQMITWSPSVRHLTALVRYLTRACEGNQQTPFAALIETAKRAQVSPEEWIRSKLPLSET